MFWTFTKWGVVAAAVGYCFYYDKKRRSAPGFKDAHRLKRKAERVAKEKEDKAALAKKESSGSANGCSNDGRRASTTTAATEATEGDDRKAS